MKEAPMVTKMKLRLQQNNKVNLVNMDIPHTNGQHTPRLKDVLEEIVDDKYYLKNETVEKIVRGSKFQERLISIKVDGLETIS